MQDLINFLNEYNVEFTVENDTVLADIVDLSYNELQSLPESIGNLKCNGLNLSYNELQSLPESIGNMKCNYLYISYNELQSLPEVSKFDSVEITDDYIYCDGILTCYESKKIIGEYTVYVGYFNNFVVSDNEDNFAHGNSIRQCISDIHFKKSDRDTSKYKNIDLNEQFDINDCIVMYRTITGACSGGVESFLQTQNVKDSYSVNEIIEITQNQYGHEQIVKFFN